MKNSIEYILSKANYRSRAFPLKNERKFIIKFTSLLHPAETSNNSDICDFLKVSDIENCMVVNGKMYILNDSS